MHVLHMFQWDRILTPSFSYMPIVLADLNGCCLQLDGDDWRCGWVARLRVFSARSHKPVEC